MILNPIVNRRYNIAQKIKTEAKYSGIHTVGENCLVSTSSHHRQAEKSASRTISLCGELERASAIGVADRRRNRARIYAEATVRPRASLAKAPR